MKCAGYFSTCLVTNRDLPREGQDAVARWSVPSARGRSEGAVEVISEAVAGGIQAVLLREKDLAPREVLAMASAVREITTDLGVHLLIHDRVDIALATGADGVHLGRLSIPVGEAKRVAPRLLIGVSCHSVHEAVHAEREGADYLFLGPIYETPSKAAFGAPLGLEVLREACQRVAIPILGIGGITAVSVAPVMACGASGVAVMGTVLANLHLGPREASRGLMAAMSECLLAYA